MGRLIASIPIIVMLIIVVVVAHTAEGARKRRTPQQRLCELMAGTLSDAFTNRWYCLAPADNPDCDPVCTRHIERRQIDPQYWQGPDPETAPAEYAPWPLAEMGPGWLATCRNICGGEDELLRIEGPNLDFRAYYTPSTDELLCHRESRCLCRDLEVWRVWTTGECSRALFDGMECPPGGEASDQ